MRNFYLGFSLALASLVMGCGKETLTSVSPQSSNQAPQAVDPRSVCESKAIAPTEIAVYTKANRFGNIHHELVFVKNIFENGTAKIEVINNKSKLKDTNRNERKIVNADTLSASISNCFGRYPNQKAAYSKTSANNSVYYKTVTIIYVFANQTALVRMENGRNTYSDLDFEFVNYDQLSPAIQ